jgi:hypothetical protein
MLTIIPSNTILFFTSDVNFFSDTDYVVCVLQSAYDERRTVSRFLSIFLMFLRTDGDHETVIIQV